MSFLFQDQNQGTRNDDATRKRARPAATVLFHPDFNRRLRSHTESADPSFQSLKIQGSESEGARGLGLSHPYRRWGVSPRPENIGRPEWTTCLNYGESLHGGQAPPAWGI